MNGLTMHTGRAQLKGNGQLRVNRQGRQPNRYVWALYFRLAHFGTFRSRWNVPLIVVFHIIPRKLAPMLGQVYLELCLATNSVAIYGYQNENGLDAT